MTVHAGREKRGLRWGIKWTACPLVTTRVAMHSMAQVPNGQWCSFLPRMPDNAPYPVFWELGKMQERALDPRNG